jgi:hypothetical protein
MRSSVHLLPLAACLAWAGPMPTPPPLKEGQDGPSAAGACTHTITSLVYGFTGSWAPTETRTTYTATETVQVAIDCAGCDEVKTVFARAPFWGGHGPVVESIIWVTATTAKKVTRAVCSPSSSAVTPAGPPHQAIPGPPVPTDMGYGSLDSAVVDDHDILAPDAVAAVAAAAAAAIDQRDADAEQRGCTSTLKVALHPHLGPTKTVWAGVKTKTLQVDCGDYCENVAIQTVDFLHPGPAVIYHTTITKNVPTYKTKYECAAAAATVAPHRHHHPDDSLPAQTPAPVAS